MRSLHGSRRLLSGTAIVATALLATLTPAIAANSPVDNAVNAAKKAQLSALLAQIAAGEKQEDIDRLKEKFPEVARVMPDPSKLEVSVKEAVTTESGETVSPDTGKLLSAAEVAEVEAPAAAQPSVASEEVETPEETEVDPEAVAVSDEASPALLAAASVSGGRWKMTHVTYTHRSYLGNTIFKYHTYARFNYRGGKVRAWGTRYDMFSNEQSGVDTGDRVSNVKSRVPASSATSMMKRKVKFQVPVWGDYATVYPWAKVKVYGSGRTKISGSGA